VEQLTRNERAQYQLGATAARDLPDVAVRLLTLGPADADLAELAMVSTHAPRPAAEEVFNRFGRAINPHCDGRMLSSKWGLTRTLMISAWHRVSLVLVQVLPFCCHWSTVRTRSSVSGRQALARSTLLLNSGPVVKVTCLSCRCPIVPLDGYSACCPFCAGIDVRVEWEREKPPIQ
jgi:hypothetical protein